MAASNQEAINGLAKSLGLESLAFTDEGICELLIDDDTVVTLEGEAEATVLQLNGVAGDLEDPECPAALQLLLQANFNGQGTGAAALGLDHVSQEVVLGQQVEVTTLGAEGLAPMFEKFANYLVFWRENLQKLTASETGNSGGAAPGPEMRV